MNKILLVFVIFLFLPVVAGCGAGTSIDTNANKVTRAAAEIADFDLPTGYRADFGASLMGYTIASFGANEQHSHLYFIQSEKQADGEDLAEMLRELVPGASGPHTRMTIIETRQAMVRGQEASLVISEGVSSDGETYRQLTAAFDGKGGPALLVLSESISQWEDETVAAFLSSIR